jgi:hypothetical protein
MTLRKTLGAAVAGVALLVAAGSAQAGLFTVNEGSVPLAIADTLTANGITFSYQAVIHQAANGSYTETGFLNKASFVDVNSAAVPSQLNSLAPAGYAIYGLFTAGGNSVANGAGGVTATFSSFNATLWLDPSQNTVQSPNGTATSGTADDTLLASYTLNVGQAHIFPGLANGDFDELLNMTLAPAGQAYFTSPTPFYPLEDLSGVTTTITGLSLPGTAFTANASGAGLELVEAPEPASIAILGAGLVALGGAIRRRKKN